MTETLKPTEEEVTAQALTLVESANNLTITDQKSYDNAVAFLPSFSKGIKTITEYFKGIKDPAYASWKAIVKKEKEALAPVETADKYVRGIVGDYIDEQDRIQKIAEEKERGRLENEAKAETKRLKDIAVRAEESAKKLREEGNEEQAELKEQKAEEKREESESVYVGPVAIEATVQKMTRFAGGGSVSKKKDIKVILPTDKKDIKELLQAMIDDLVPLTCVQFSENRLKAFAKLNEITGKKHGVIFQAKSGVNVRA